MKQSSSSSELPGVRSMGSSVSNWLTERGFADLTDVTLADEDTTSMITDNANRTIQVNALQVTQPAGQLWYQFRYCHLVPQFSTDVSSTTCLPMCSQCKYRNLVIKFVVNASCAIWTRYSIWWPNLNKCKCPLLVVKTVTNASGTTWWPIFLAEIN